MAAVLGGTQSLHTNSMDETLALPSEKAAEIALRTPAIDLPMKQVSQMLLIPLGGSWFIEKLTDEMENKAEQYFKEIDDMGGVISAIENGYQQREIGKSASNFQNNVDKNERVVVGVNDFINENEDIDIPILEIDTRAEKNQMERLIQIKSSRDSTLTSNLLDSITKACKNGGQPSSSYYRCKQKIIVQWVK